MQKKRRVNRSSLPPLIPDFSKPVPKTKCQRCEAQQQIIDDLRVICGEYKRVIRLLQTVQIPKPAEAK